MTDFYTYLFGSVSIAQDANETIPDELPPNFNAAKHIIRYHKKHVNNCMMDKIAKKEASKKGDDFSPDEEVGVQASGQVSPENDIIEGTKENTDGRTGFHERISEEPLRSVQESTRLLEGASDAARRGEAESIETQGRGLPFDKRAAAQERAVKWFAQGKGVWHENVDLDFDKEYGEGISGAETLVYFDEKNGIAHKVMSDNFYRDPAENIERVKIFNRLFPETSLLLKGFGTIGSNWMGSRFALIVDQPLIHIKRGATEDEVRELMEGLGFRLQKEDEWINDEGIIVSDLHDENAVIDDFGNTVVIDCAIQRKTTNPFLQ